MKANELYARVQQLGGLSSRAEGRRWATETLRALWHILPDAESRRHFASQLPGAVKSGLLAEPPRELSMTREVVIQHVAAALGVHASEGARALSVVYRVLTEALSPGQIAELRAHVPADLSVFLQEQAAAAPAARP